MLGVVCKLRLLLARQVFLEYIEAAVFFAQVVERVTVCTPNRVSVFAGKVCQLFISSFAIGIAQPDIAGN